MSWQTKIRRIEGTPGLWEFQITDDSGDVVEAGATMGERACRELATRALKRLEDSEWRSL